MTYEPPQQPGYPQYQQRPGQWPQDPQPGQSWPQATQPPGQPWAAAPQQQPYPGDQGAWPPYQGQQPPGGYVPPGPPDRRRARKRHPVRNLLIGGTVVLVAIIIGSAAASGGNHTLTSTGSSTPATSPAASAKAAGSSKTTQARVGSSIVLTGNGNGEQMTVTVVKVFRHAEPATEIDGPESGKRLYAVQFRLANSGTAAYSDSPSNGTVVVDSAGQSYQASLDDASECQSFPGTENIAPGSSGLGCVVYEVPVKATITKVQFTLDSGMGPQTGQWDVRK